MRQWFPARYSTARRWLQKAGHMWRRHLAEYRLLPEFVVIGTQRGGTTSLFRYLREHPLVMSSSRKEVHYFDLNYYRTVDWYRSFFPLRFRAKYVEAMRGGRPRTGEASPYYMYHPAVPERMHRLLPNVRLIVLLRNPVERAFSHHGHEVRNGREPLSFEKAIEREEARLEEFTYQQWSDPNFHSEAHQRFSYVSRGFYADQLQRWFECFSRDQIFIRKSEELFEEPKQLLEEVQGFLGLPQYPYEVFKVHNAGGGPRELRPETREQLRERFEPHNRRLRELIGEEFSWWETTNSD